jgi:predicted ester cyclase
MNMTPKDFITTWFEHIDGKKFDGLKKLMDKNHQFNNPMAPAPLNSEQHLGMMQMMTASFEGEYLIDKILTEGEWVTARGRWTGKHTGEFNGIPATGKKVEFSWLDMMHIVNGKVVEEYFEMNPMSIMTQIGAVPA